MYEEIGAVSHSTLYGDIAEVGGLSAAIQAQLNAIGSTLCVTKTDPALPRLPFDWDVVRHQHRFCQTTIAANQRLFMVDFWDRGICLGHGSTPSIAKLAEVINAWVGETSSYSDLQLRFPFVGFEAIAACHEQGAAAEVEQKWQLVYSREKRDDTNGVLLPLVEKAMESPVLRRLFPFTSLNALCFSRCTGYPLSGDCPAACPSPWAVKQGFLTPEQRSAMGSEKPFTVYKDHFLGQDDAAEAVELIVRHLPPGCGPAVQGTADDL